MQIDFHHATTYVIARYAGFEHDEADIIAYCSQYVDDATNSGTLKFDVGAMYHHISSAHNSLDYRNFDELSNHQVWIPFHFLPGNGQKPAGESPAGGFIEKLICRPNSPIAQDMVHECIANKNKPYGLHRLGITMHIYADTWAHQGFAGVAHDVNDIHTLDEQGDTDVEFLDKKKAFFKGIINQVTGKFIGDVLPLGHGAALSQPDKPYLKWSYYDHNNQLVKRDNTEFFLEAANFMCIAMQRYQAGDPVALVDGLPQCARDKIKELFLTITDEDGDDRHQRWLDKIANGFFDDNTPHGFKAVSLEYQAKGRDSWKHKALNTAKLTESVTDVFPYHDSFLKSDWKMFHDALLAQHFFIVHELLPSYGICAA
ncbi:MAG: hypothetical protein NTV43_08620 [Methylococcales bacterium]|nr:hypothetical protein [Methylococcales bacterium]